MGREAILTALDALVANALPQAARRGFEGEPGKPDVITSGGAVGLLGVDAGDPEVDLNPPTYHFETAFTLAVLADTIEQAGTMMTAIGAAIVADRTLGDTCDWAEGASSGLDEETMTGVDGYVEGRCLVTTAYSTTNPLG